jgi:hypothetical protein
MKGYIYSIRSHQTKDIYIGSTEQSLCKRMRNHRAAYKMWINGNKAYCKSYEIQKYGDSYIELIIEVEVQSRPDLKRIEGEHQRATKCVNNTIAGRTRKEYYQANADNINEYKKEYYESNKKMFNDKAKEYYKENKENIKGQKKEKYTCECGSVICRGDKSQHLKTKKHINLLNKL